VSDVVLIDYGAGNLRSLTAAFERLGAAVTVTGEAERVRAAPRLVLPGVGAAEPAMRALEAAAIPAALRGALATGARLLGVCLGMQLLLERSAEGDVACLGLVPGTVERIDWARRLPHMGWNDVAAVGDGPLAGALPAVCYFAHSYAARPQAGEAVTAETEIAAGTGRPSISVSAVTASPACGRAA